MSKEEFDRFVIEMLFLRGIHSRLKFQVLSRIQLSLGSLLS